MKKIIFIFSAILTMMIAVAQPIIIKPIRAFATGDFTGFSVEPEPILEDMWSSDTLPQKYKTIDQITYFWNSNGSIQNDDYFISFVGFYREMYYYTIGLCFSSADVSFDNGVLTISNAIAQNASHKGEVYYCDWFQGSNSESSIQILPFTSAILDFNNNSYTINNGDTYAHINFSRYTCTKTWRIYSNIPDTLSSGDLNVFVSFSPSLSGNVDRSINNNGVQSMRSQLYMQVLNQSIFPIQYKMAIYKKHQQTSRGGDLTVGDNVFYDSDPIFVYYSDNWVYCTNCDSESTFLNSDTVKENKSCPWHYVSASSQDIVTFDFNQINMLEGEEYSVYVYAVRNDYGYASEQIVYLASSDPALAALYQIQGDDIETVYQSDFVMINYNDVKYDPNNSNNGVKPFNGRDGFAATQQYSYSRNARENQDGTIDYSSRNLYTNQNSWLSQQRSNALANHSTYSSGRVPASLSTHFNNFLSFITAVFGRMPTDIQSLYIYGFIALVVLGIVLKVVK